MRNRKRLGAALGGVILIGFMLSFFAPVGSAESVIAYSPGPIVASSGSTLFLSVFNPTEEAVMIQFTLVGASGFTPPFASPQLTVPASGKNGHNFSIPGPAIGEAAVFLVAPGKAKKLLPVAEFTPIGATTTVFAHAGDWKMFKG